MLTAVIVVGLASGYISFAVIHKAGMFGVFRKLRRLLSFAKLVQCSFCFSFYVAVVAHLAMNSKLIVMPVRLLMLSFASATIASYFCSQVMHTYSEGGDDDDSLQEDRSE
jgi:hypothetical protein